MRLARGKEIYREGFNLTRAVPIDFSTAAGDGDTTNCVFMIVLRQLAASGIMRFPQTKRRHMPAFQNKSGGKCLGRLSTHLDKRGQLNVVDILGSALNWET